MKVVVDWGSKRTAMKRGERRKFLHSEGRKLMISSYKRLGSKQKFSRRTKKVQCYENQRRELLEEKNS